MPENLTKDEKRIKELRTELAEMDRLRLAQFNHEAEIMRELRKLYAKYEREALLK